MSQKFILSPPNNSAGLFAEGKCKGASWLEASVSAVLAGGCSQFAMSVDLVALGLNC